MDSLTAIPPPPHPPPEQTAQLGVHLVCQSTATPRTLPEGMAAPKVCSLFLAAAKGRLPAAASFSGGEHSGTATAAAAAAAAATAASSTPPPPLPPPKPRKLTVEPPTHAGAPSRIRSQPGRLGRGSGRGKARVPFSATEEAALRRGVEKHGFGSWSKILADGSFHPSRASGALKDKARTMRLAP